MAELGIFDFTWVRGTTAPLMVQMVLNEAPIEFDDIRLTVSKKGGKTVAFRLTLEEHAGIGPGSVQIVSPGIVKFTPTAAQTRSLDETPNDGTPGKNRYEIELRDGADENVYLVGTIAAVGGINDDEAIS